MSREATDYRELFKRALLALDEMKAKLEAVERPRTEPIAIIGMGCRLPGGADDPEAFWRLLSAGADCIREVPAERWDLETFYDPEQGAPGKMYTRRGGFLDNMDGFDPHFFGIAPREALSMDPQQRLLLEICWEALEDAGLAPARLAGSATGVFIGMTSWDYSLLQTKAGEPGDTYFTTGTAHSIAAGRLSYLLDLRGPNFAVDTACSSSLVALHLACQSLKAGESRTALAGGVNLILSPDTTIGTCQARMMSADGLCKTFDASANGYVRGEGCGIVVLKRLSDALADGDRILALVRGTAVNQDGRSSGITAPNGPAQEAVVREALSRAGLTGDQVGYIEAHGTGTSLGDPIEVRALASVLGPGRAASRPLLIGSVKTNIGHLESAAGVAGLIKVILALRHDAIPPQLHFKVPNPLIPWDALPVKVVGESTAWPAGERRIAGVSSFGFSGTNAHVLLEEAPEPEPRTAELERPLHLLALSAKTPAALGELIRRYQGRLEQEGAYADVCFTANSGRGHFAERLAVVADSAQEARGLLAAALEEREAAGLLRGRAAERGRPALAFLFTGQGSQYFGMARELFGSQPTFRKALQECDEILLPLLPRPLLSVLYAEEGTLLDETGFTQPALFSLEYAVAKLWRSWGIEPTLVMGHSVGEYAAACVAGVFSLEEGSRLIAARGRLMQALPRGGGMAAVLTDESRVKDAIQGLEDRLSIAAVNGPTNVVVSGDSAALQAVVERFRAEGVRSQALTVSHAFHSPLMEPMLREFEGLVRQVSFAEPRLGLVSNLTGRVASAEELADPAYWCRHVREAVRFSAGIQTLSELGCEVFLEVGPQPTLLGMGARCIPDGQGQWLASLRKGKRDWRQLLETLGTLYTLGAEPDWRGFDRDYPRSKVSLPSYPFQRESYWLEAARRGARPAGQGGGSGVPTGHPLLGHRLQSPLADTSFESGLAPDRLAYLQDHGFFGRPVFPAAGYVELALAASATLGSGLPAVEDLTIEEALQLGEGESQLIQLVLSPDGGFQIFSPEAESEPGVWRRHAVGRVRLDDLGPAVSGPTLDEARNRCATPLPPADFYSFFRKSGVEYGPAFQGAEQIWTGEGEGLAHVRLPAALVAGAAAYRFHPVLLDAGLQVLGAALWSGMAPDSSLSYMPTGAKRLRMHGSIGTRLWAHLSIRGGSQPGAPSLTADLRFFDEDGRLVADVERLEFMRATREALEASRSRALVDALYQLSWEERAVEAKADAAGSWLIFGDAAGLGAELAARLRSHGGSATVVLPGRALERIDTDERRIDPVRAEHYDALFASAGDGTAGWRGVVHLWSLDSRESSVDPIAGLVPGTASALRLVQAMVRAGGARSPRLWLVTQGAIAIEDSERVALAQAPVWGLGRTIALEHPELACTRLDLEAGAAAADTLLTELLGADDEDQVAYRHGERRVARLTRARALRGDGQRPLDAQALQLQITSRGVLDNLRLAPVARRPPSAGEVEIKVAASGLNFRDVLNALGMYPGDPGPLGGECSGRILAVGDGVLGFEVGDEVMAMATGSFSTHVTVPALLVARKPKGWRLENAASVPIVFLTAQYGLNHLAHMKAGERVLIHAGAGGVGMAAIQLAQQAGAEIYATAGSPAKRDLLASLGVRHIFDSRSLSFADGILERTQGEGVDVVLNSLTGDFIPRSLSLLRAGGRFLEIGKRGIWDPEQVQREKPGVAYHVIYLGEVADNDPGLIRTMFEELLKGFEAGALTHITRRVFSVRKAVDAFRYMAQAKHVGKIVVRQERDKVVVRPDAGYLITGGLGALGVVFAKWLVAQGARHLALLGRREPSSEVGASLKELEQHGARILTLQADMSREEDVARALAETEASLPPLKGVIHAAGVLDDGVLLQQSWERFAGVMAPKVKGGWLLHSLTRDRDLDFLVFFSSMASLLGSPGQGNYAAGNAYLDGLAALRRSEGLPGLSINWGPWGEVGMAASLTEQDRRRWADRGVRLITPDQGVQILGLLLGQDMDQVGVFQIDWGLYVRQFGQGAPPPLFRTVARERAPRAEARREAQGDAGLRGRLEAAPPNERYEILLTYVRDQVARVLGLDPSRLPSLTQGLTDMGMDSLMIVELRNHLQASLGTSLPSTLVFEHPTIEALSAHLAQDVLELATPATPSLPEQPSTSEDTQVDGLSQKELEVSLLKEVKEAGY